MKKSFLPTLSAAIALISIALLCAASGCGADEAPVTNSLPAREFYRYFHGLDEQVLVRKSMKEMVGVRSDGRVQPLQQIIDADELAWRAAHGSIAQPFEAKIQNLTDDTVVEFMALFRPSIDWARVQQDLWSRDEETRRLGSAELEQAISTKAAMLVEQLKGLNITIDVVGESMPIVAGRGSVKDVRAAARLPGITYLNDAAGGTPVENTTIVDPIEFHEVDGANGAFPTLAGNEGDGEAVGLIDPSTGCDIRDDNIWFNGVPIADRTPLPLPCVDDEDCDVCGGGTCWAHGCFDEHATQVMNVMTRMTPHADYFFANTGSATQFISPVCSANIVNALDWLITKNDTLFINESYECDDDTALDPTDGIAEDYYSRTKDVFFTKAGRNIGDDSEDACPNQWNSVCVGGVRADHTRSCFSVWSNPGRFQYTSNWALDREEPDVVAYAGNYKYDRPECDGQEVHRLLTATAANPLQPVETGGNSLAAPAVLSMAVLAKQYCDTQDIFLNSVALRAMVRNGANAENPEGWKYSTLRPEDPTDPIDPLKPLKDHVDGGGFLDAFGLKRYCDPNGGGDIWLREIDPQTDGSLSGLPKDCAPQHPKAPPGEQHFTQPQAQDLDCSNPGSVRWLNLFDVYPGGVRTLAKPDRLRVTFSWEACVTSSNPATGTQKVNDYDIFLYNATKEFGYYASQTTDDVNEGFDVEIIEAEPYEYQLLLVWPDGTKGCDGGIDRTALAVEVY